MGNPRPFSLAAQGEDVILIYSPNRLAEKDEDALLQEI